MPRKLPPLNQLRAFEAAARHLSFRKAGDELNVTHAAISHQIKALEEYFELRLFKRTTRKIELNEIAVPLYEKTRQALDLLAEGVSQVSAPEASGALRLSVAPSFASHWLLKRLPEFHEAHPEFQIDIDMSVDLLSFDEGAVDVALRTGFGDWAGLTSHRLFDENIFAVAAPAVAKEASEFSFRNARLLTATAREGEWEGWLEAMGRSNEMSNDVIVFATQALALDGAISGLGVALADRRLIVDHLAEGRLKLLSPESYKPGRGLYLVHPEPPRTADAVSAFTKWITAEMLKDV
ncbi:MAG: LysR substrate-binding domain-containing protein [Pikeienuella sp.]